LAEEVGRGESEADHFFLFTRKRNVAQHGIDSRAADHALHCGDVSARKTSFAEQLTSKFSAAIDVRCGVFRTGSFEVVTLFEIASVVEKNAEYAKLEQSFGYGTLTICALPSMQQSVHAERALKCMLKVVVARVHRLIIGVVPAETFNGEAECARDEQPVTGGKH
jgi:hypothetical protein